MGVSRLHPRKARYASSWKDTAKQDRQIISVRCESCGGAGTKENPLHRHHIRTKARRGPDILLNLKILCKTCHERTHRR